jgi:hypothetical protein
MRVAVGPVGEKLDRRGDLTQRQGSGIAGGFDGVPDHSRRCMRLALRIAAECFRDVVVERMPDVLGVVEDRRNPPAAAA